MTSWQGGGLVVDRLHRVAEGVYQTTKAIPVYGKWKTMLRLENGRGVRAVPIYLPADPAIPAKAVPARDSFTRPFVRDKKVLQREAVGGIDLARAAGLPAAAGHRGPMAGRARPRPAPPRDHGRRALGGDVLRAARGAAAAPAAGW